MKNVMKAIGFVGIMLTACAQENEDVPTSVETAFNEKFPNAQNVEWEKEADTEWEAEFKLDGVEYSANFSNEGKWMETEHEIKSSELPDAVMKTIAARFGDYEIKKVEIAEKLDGVVYEVDLEKGEEELEVVFDANGKVIKKVELDDEDED